MAGLKLIQRIITMLMYPFVIFVGSLPKVKLITFESFRRKDIRGLQNYQYKLSKSKQDLQVSIYNDSSNFLCYSTQMSIRNLCFFFQQTINFIKSIFNKC